MHKLHLMWSGLRASLWFLPGLIVVCSVVLAVALVEIDGRVRPEFLAEYPRLFGTGAEGSRGMLGTIAGSMITVAGVTFSITIVALSLASSQYTPRILRNFMSDRANQSVLGVFVAAVIIFPAFKPGDLVAGLGITSVAIGFAFKDVLQNFFAGILILWRRPFVVGDQIRAKDYEGTVEEITVRSTRLKTYDGERAVLPNGDVYTSAILVRTAYDKRRVRFTVGIGYPDSIEEARGIIHGVLKETEGVLDDPGPWVYVTELAPSSVNFTVYFWTASQQANVAENWMGLARINPKGDGAPTRANRPAARPSAHLIRAAAHLTRTS